MHPDAHNSKNQMPSPIGVVGGSGGKFGSVGLSHLGCIVEEGRVSANGSDTDDDFETFTTLQLAMVGVAL